jgi:hypothetical protein
MLSVFRGLRPEKLLGTRLLTPSTKIFYQQTTPLKMNSTTAAYQTSHADGDSALPPKQTSVLQKVKLNDGNEIPTVS